MKRILLLFQLKQTGLKIYIYFMFILPEARVLNFRLVVQEIVFVYSSPEIKIKEQENFKLLNCLCLI